MNNNSHTFILLTGGAGYIGSHVYYALADAGYIPVVIDDLSTGVRKNLPEDCIFYEGGVSDTGLLETIFKQHDIAAIMHFAGSTDVAESVADPEKYERNNTRASQTLIDNAIQNGIQYFVFSSSAAVYGIPERLPVTENMAAVPISPYGKTKLDTEEYLKSEAIQSHMNSAILRYFNVAGADDQGRTGPIDKPYKHVIACATEHVLGQRESFMIFGNDYDTPDGTAVRDFIHVSDLADLHVLALEHLMNKPETFIINCGYGTGLSILQLADALKSFADDVRIEYAPRREADIPESYADITKLKSMLSWSPKHNSLDEIIASEIAWTKKRDVNG